MTKSFRELCDQNGFEFQEHTVLTEDDYMLSLFRIPGLKHEVKGHGGKKVKSPVFF